MYGITPQDIDYINLKLSKQEKFLTNSMFDFGNSDKSILDFTYSANLNPKKYFAEMNNRINSIFDYAKDKGFYPVFATLTAPSKFHKKNRSGDLKIQPNETAKEISKIFNKFTNLKLFQRLRKDIKHSLMYFRVYEPHKSGVPHCHIMMFLPKDYILEVKNKFYEYFTDSKRWGNNKKSLDFRYTWYNSAGGAVSYIMKYITKTFKNPNDDSIQHATYWYMKHNVRRFLCSRTLAPVTLYRRIRHYFKKENNDYLKITDHFKTGSFKYSFNSNNLKVPTKGNSIDYDKAKTNLLSTTTISYIYYDHDSGEIDEVTLWQKNTDLILRNRKLVNKFPSFNKPTVLNPNFNLNQSLKPNTLNHAVNMHFCSKNTFYSKPHYELPYIYKKDKSFTFEKTVSNKIFAYQLSNSELQDYYSELDDITSLDYKLARNEMLKRNLLNNINFERRKVNLNIKELSNLDNSQFIINNQSSNLFDVKAYYNFTTNTKLEKVNTIPLETLNNYIHDGYEEYVNPVTGEFETRKKFISIDEIGF